MDYFTFGGIVPGSESGTWAGTGIDRFKFAAREWDSEIGLYYNRARYYDPNSGRFISEDPIQFRGGQANLYAYTWNQPIGLTDPTGHDGWSITAGGIAGGILATAVVVTFLPVTAPAIIGAGIIAGGTVVGGLVGNAVSPNNPAGAALVGGVAGGAFAYTACVYGPAAWRWLAGLGGGGSGGTDIRPDPPPLQPPPTFVGDLSESIWDLPQSDILPVPPGFQPPLDGPWPPPPGPF